MELVIAHRHDRSPHATVFRHPLLALAMAQIDDILPPFISSQTTKLVVLTLVLLIVTLVLVTLATRD